MMPKHIKSLLSSNEETKQLKGIMLAQEGGVYILIPQILRLASSTNKEVSKKAGEVSVDLARRCVQSKDRDIPETLISSSVATIRKLDPQFIMNLHQLVLSHDPPTAIKALITVKHFINEKQAEDILKNALKHPNNKIRATAVLHIGMIASKVNADVLSKFLDDSDNRVKANTIEVLERLNNKIFIRILSRFKNDKNNRIRANALKALFTMGDYGLKNDFQFMLMEPNYLMRASAVWALGEIGMQSPQLLRLLNIVKNDPNEMVRRNLLIVLKKVGNVPELDFLREVLREDMKRQLQDRIINQKNLKMEHNKTPNYFELKLKGVITAQSVLALKFQLDDLVSRENKFVFSFEEVEYIDSSGIGLLVNFNRSLEKKDGFLYIYGCNYRITELFQLSKIHTILNIFHSLEEIHEFLVIPDKER